MQRFVLLVAVGIGLVRGQVSDIAGWSDTRWGMTVEEVSRTKSGSGLAPKPEPAVAPKTPPKTKAYSASDIEVEGRKFTVTLGFDLATKKLVSVFINPAARDSSVGDFNSLEAGLISKYGKPTYSKDGREDEATVRRWVFSSTTIELHSIELMMLKKTLVILFYTPTQKTAL
jgi:hypothetical protein